MITDEDWLKNNWIKKIVEAAKACDEKLHGNGLALSLLPSYNYTRARVNARCSEEGYWTSRFLKKVFHDLKKDALSLHAAAKDLGVTPEMLHNAMYEVYTVFDEAKIKLLSLSEFVENDIGTRSQYWKDSKIQDSRFKILFAFKSATTRKMVKIT